MIILYNTSAKWKWLKFCTHTFDGLGFNVETVEYKNVSFTVWDVGGQDKVFMIFWSHLNLLIRDEALSVCLLSIWAPFEIRCFTDLFARVLYMGTLVYDNIPADAIQTTLIWLYAKFCADSTIVETLLSEYTRSYLCGRQ